MQSNIKLKKVHDVSKALIIGCGSIGQRHIRNLKKIGIESITALRSKAGHFNDLPTDLNVNEVDSWDDALSENPDIAIISNPTSLHLECLNRLIPYVKGVLVEKPLSHSLDGVDEISALLRNNKATLFMGHNLIFHPIVKSIEEFISLNDVGNMLNIQFQFGQWLPSWHPYEDYTKGYYARKDLGGGVSLTLIHEIHLAIVLAGDPVEVCGMVSDSDLLNLDVDTISDTMVKHRTGCVSQIHLDYLQSPPHRSGLISFERGWISYDFNESRVVAQRPEDKKPFVIWADGSYDMNQMYVEEVEAFVQYVEEGRVKHPFDINSAVESLKLVEALFKSHLQKKNVIIPCDKRFEF